LQCSEVFNEVHQSIGRGSVAQKCLNIREELREAKRMDVMIEQKIKVKSMTETHMEVS
jgi:hypothetical protein